MPRLLRCRFWKSGSWRAEKSDCVLFAGSASRTSILIDVGAPVGELAHAGRTGAHAGEIEHAQACERL